ncbi:MAG: UDP-3-O-(3-hydroxymyristoyl)glucosamine N-acyltransferase [Mariprofundaceae bacterium]|nr:UDP-3-O-(3-hydroxymyristoyl)glucosamine N-acyltransferase [Mariprofundaceae bacterium]
MTNDVSLRQLLELIQCPSTVEHNQRKIRGITTLAVATEEHLSFLANKRYRAALSSTQAAAVLVDQATYDAWQAGTISCDATLLACADPYLAFALVQRFFHPQATGLGDHHPSAVIHPDADIADSVDIAPQAVIGRGSRIAKGCRIGTGVVVGDDCIIEENCLIHPRVVIADGCHLGKRVIIQAGAVIGSDGFGYAWNGISHVKIPQTGAVYLHDDVEVGANACIDRGALEDTVIHEDVKIDNLVQIGHNAEIGSKTVIVSQVGVAGSTTIGRGCQLGGQAGVAGHLTVGDFCKIAGQSGVIGNLEAGGVYGGTPAVPHRMWLKGIALVNRLPELFKKQ